MNIIETHQLTHRYWRTEALRGLDLTVPAGSVFALLGANGAGKTTAIKVLMNLLRPTAGEARVLGVDSRRLGELRSSHGFEPVYAGRLLVRPRRGGCGRGA